LIGQFGVGFYSSFLVADRVVVTSKNKDDKQHIWESDATQFSVTEDPRGAEHQLPRGTTISLYLKEEAHDFLEPSTIEDLVKKYSQFIDFNIYLWKSSTVSEEVPVEDEESKDETKEKKDDEEKKEDDEEDAKVEENEEEEKKPKTKTVEKTKWDWELMNGAKPLWQRSPKDVKDEEYNEFYKAITKDHDDAMAHTHFTAEGEVTFKSVLFVPKTAPHDTFSNYGNRKESIKMYVRRVFITDDFQDMLPKYLSFIKGIVDSDDLPLNVSREQLQQHKLLKVIKKKLVRKALDMIKKMSDEDFLKFWKEYSTNIKLGVMEDHTNRTRLAKLLRFRSSNDAEKQTSLADYISRMKDKQETIFYIAASSLQEAKDSPFVEKPLKDGYEVLYLTEPIDEYCVQSLPEFEGKKLQNLSKEGAKFGDEDDAKEKAKQEALTKEFEPLTKWLKDESLIKDKIEKATLSKQLAKSPAALVASTYGHSGNMERIMNAQAYAKAKDPSQASFAQKKTLELNPNHKFVKLLLTTLDSDKDSANQLALSLFHQAALSSGFSVDNKEFAASIQQMLCKIHGINPDELVEEEEEVKTSEPEEVVADDDKETADSKEESATGGEDPVEEDKPKEEL